MGYLWVASAKEIKHVCSQIQAGQSKQDVIDLMYINLVYIQRAPTKNCFPKP
jgi:hypothetical protein